MRKSVKAISLSAFVLSLGLTGCSSNAQNAPAQAPASAENAAGVDTVVVGANPIPHAKILEFIQQNLAEKAGLKLVIKQFDDYIQPNEALQSGDLDANYFQTIPYLKAQSEKRGYNFVPGKPVHLEPLAVYSKKIKKIEDLPAGGQIGIISDPTNQERALRLLAQAKLVEIPVSGEVTVNTVKKLKDFNFHEVAAPQLARALDDVDVAVINGNYAQSIGLAPKKDGLVVEATENNPASNLLVWPNGKETEGVKKLEKLLHTDEVRQFINQTWPDGAVIPSF
ncbi:ABC transporter [Actinomycetaceae bacterium TAE3-ERU4]|nr:ABC transporter [Actinomycetaceae bacterium TAE3-ERU4]